jgi:hypothetical protein
VRHDICTAPIRLDLPYLEFSIGMIDHASESFPMLIKEISCLGSSDVAGVIQTPKPSFHSLRCWRQQRAGLLQ